MRFEHVLLVQAPTLITSISDATHKELFIVIWR